jgi:hypothetical protein
LGKFSLKREYKKNFEFGCIATKFKKLKYNKKYYQLLTYMLEAKQNRAKNKQEMKKFLGDC